MKYVRILAAAALLFCTPALAQWQVPSGSIPVGRGAGTGFASIKPFFDVTAPPYNATCNGSANDTTAINAAITAANAAGGGIVTAPNGKVCIIQTGTSVLLLDNVCIKGNFTLRGTSVTNNTEMITATNKTSICVEDVTIDMINSFVTGNGNNAAMSFAGTTLTGLTVRVQNVKIINHGNYGIVINGGTYWLLNNQITMNSPYGVVAGVGQQNHAILIACSFVSVGVIDGTVTNGSSINSCSQQSQITNNRVAIWSYGSGIGHGGLGLPCTLKGALGLNSCASIIAFNEVSGGLGIDANSFVNAGIETYDPYSLVIGNHISNVAGTGIIGGGTSIASNSLSDTCTYYATAAISGGCFGIVLRNDGAGGNPGSYVSLVSNKVFASFGAPMAVTGTQNVAGVIRIIVASTATVGPTNTIVPCRATAVGGTTNANKGWTSCKVIDATHIELTGSVFNSAWTSGGTIGPQMDYAYSEASAAMPGIKMGVNTFFSGLTGTYDILNTGTTSSSPACSGACTVSDGALMVGLAGANNVWVPRALSGDATLNSGAALTLATVNANVGSFGSATQSGTFTVNAKGLITAASGVTVTPAVGSITGLGTGVATALAVNVGSAGAFVTFNGALGSPSSVGTLPAHTLGGAVTGGGQNITGLNNLSATTVTGGSSTDSISGSVAAGALARVASFLSPSMSNDQKVYMTLGSANSSNNSFYFFYNHHSTTASRYFGFQPFEAGAGTGFNLFADLGASLGDATSPGAGIFRALNGFIIGTAAKTLTLKQGANGAVGTFVCTGGGTITINNTFVAANDNIIISLNTVGGTITTPPAMKAITAATSFQVLCGATDTSTYNYGILKNAA